MEVCTYKEQLLSFCKQTVIPYEVIICDDCSTDNTIQIIEDLIYDLPFTVKTIKNESNLGSTIQDGYGITFSIAAKQRAILRGKTQWAYM